MRGPQEADHRRGKTEAEHSEIVAVEGKACVRVDGTSCGEQIGVNRSYDADDDEAQWVRKFRK